MKAHDFKLYSLGVLCLSLFASVVFAQNIFDITYPVSELGNCESQSACKTYCDNPEHKNACYQFAVSKGLIKEAKKPHGDEAQKGPGGCNSKGACRAYCELEANFETCMQYAEENDLMTKNEIGRARKFRNKTGPGGCKGEACKAYCDTPGHEEECLEFAEREGLIPKDEIERAKKFMRASSKGGPGGCKGRQCEQYCNNIEHRDECFEFAKKNDLLDAGELERIEKGRALEAKVKESGGPGGCKDEKSCMAYCHDPGHVEECLGFATAHGGMDAEEAERMLKEFTEHGDAFGPGRMGKPNMPGREYKDHLEKFEDFQKMEKVPAGEFPRGMKGPGGCTSPDECMKYCTTHREECSRSSRDAKDGFRPEGRPFDGGEFKPEGRPFEGVPPAGGAHMEGVVPGEANQFRPPPPAGNQYPTRPPEMMPPTTGGFDQNYQQQYRQEFQKQYEQQFQQQQDGSLSVPPPVQQAPSEPVRTEPPAALRRTVEAFANVMFAPVMLLEYLMAR